MWKGYVLIGEIELKITIIMIIIFNSIAFLFPKLISMYYMKRSRAWLLRNCICALMYAITHVI